MLTSTPPIIKQESVIDSLQEHLVRTHNVSTDAMRTILSTLVVTSTTTPPGLTTRSPADGQSKQPEVTASDDVTTTSVGGGQAKRQSHHPPPHQPPPHRRPSSAGDSEMGPISYRMTAVNQVTAVDMEPSTPSSSSSPKLSVQSSHETRG